MTTEQNAIEYVKDQMDKGIMSASEANVTLIKMVGYRVIAGKLTKDVRDALNNAVKNKEIGKLKSNGLKLAIYYNLNCKARAIDEQNRIFLESVGAIRQVCA